MNKKIDFLSNKKIDYIELSNEIKAEVGILAGLDMFTYAHVLGVTDTTYKICATMHMPYNELRDCVLGAYLHDVGKIFVPSEILQKNAMLTDEEYEVMKQHTIKGYETCMEYPEYNYLANIARWHHESFDGSGYPDGIKGEEIPYEVSLIKVADVYDALTRKRQYKEGYTQTHSLKIMIDEVKNNRMCARFLYYLILALLKELNQKIEEAYKSVCAYQDEVDALQDLESIYKEIYDKGYTHKLKRKLNRYDLAPNYDMSTNAQLLISKQKVYENELKNYEFLLSEKATMEKQLNEVKHLYKEEKWYKD